MTTRLVARFETDTEQHPKFTERKGKKHYGITLEVENPPPDAYAATFELDPSYRDPWRTLAPDPEGKFKLTTTSYGNFEVLVRVRTKRGEMLVANNLYRALRDTVGATASNPKVDEALKYIASH
jgi:hypothetical protein